MVAFRSSYQGSALRACIFALFHPPTAPCYNCKAFYKPELYCSIPRSHYQLYGWYMSLHREAKPETYFRALCARKKESVRAVYFLIGAKEAWHSNVGPPLLPRSSCVISKSATFKICNHHCWRVWAAGNFEPCTGEIYACKCEICASCTFRSPRSSTLEGSRYATQFSCAGSKDCCSCFYGLAKRTVWQA